ncbi:MAG: hypothetical protein IKG15_03805 [Solobacterium sp.]|nr:hypothetical protein [Solobacterium sp.]
MKKSIKVILIPFILFCTSCGTKEKNISSYLAEHRNYTAHVTITENNTIIQKMNYLADIDNCGEVNMFVFNGIDSDRVVLYNSKEAESYGRDIYDGYLFEGSWGSGLEMNMIPRFDQNMIDASEYIMSNMKVSKQGSANTAAEYTIQISGDDIPKVMEYLGKDTEYAELNPSGISFSLSLEEQNVVQIKYALTSEDKTINMETFFNQYDHTFTGLGCQYFH